MRTWLSVSALLALWACDPEPQPTDDTDVDTDPVDTIDTPDDTDVPLPTDPNGHGPVAPEIMGRLGDPVPYATAEQLATYERGRQVALRRFSLEDGLGPSFNLTSCVGCHEKPATGGSAGLYRNFFLTGAVAPDGTYTDGTSAGKSGGVLRLYSYDEAEQSRPAIPPTTNVFAQRNPIPFFGVGLLAELTNEELLSRADPDDLDGDGISGKPNWDQGYVGRFGMKSQTVNIEGFIRGPIFNHLGITTDPLTEEQKAALPVDSSTPGALPEGASGAAGALWAELLSWAQAAAPSGPLTDMDAAPDPEMSTTDLFDLVSFAMLTAAPLIDPPTRETERGRRHFDEAGCASCHTPRVTSPRGPLPVYSDLLLHDMGPELADGIKQKEANGSEFRTQPLWGVAAEGPFLHDGRAGTLAAAILEHGGEAERSRDRFEALDDTAQAELIAFIRSLGGRDQESPGLIPPGTPITAPGAYGGPVRELDAAEQARFLAGRDLFDREFNHEDGVGAPRMNGDSCRACHFEPVFGGAGPRDVNVTRHGVADAEGDFIIPNAGTILHRTTILTTEALKPQGDAAIFEMRQTPHLFGLGVIETISDATILAGADPYDTRTPDGISGKPSYVDGGRLGRFGWKAQVPTIPEFIRDAVGAELGMTMLIEPGLTFGRLQDNDGVPDPEYSLDNAGLLVDFLRMLAPPPRTASADPVAAARGEAVFSEVGCAACHTPSLPGSAGPVPLFSDLLLHDILPAGTPGIEDASATVTEFRTAPLWGLATSAPYLHDGRADDVLDAITGHDGEAAAIRDAALALPAEDLAALLLFLETL